MTNERVEVLPVREAALLQRMRTQIALGQQRDSQGLGNDGVFSQLSECVARFEARLSSQSLPVEVSPGTMLDECIAEIGDAEPFVFQREADGGYSVTQLSAWKAVHERLASPQPPRMRVVDKFLNSVNLDVSVRLLRERDTLRKAINLALQCTPSTSPDAVIVYDCGDPREILRAALKANPGGGDA